MKLLLRRTLVLKKLWRHCVSIAIFSIMNQYQIFELLIDLSPTNDFYDISGILFTVKLAINLEWLIEKLSTNDDLTLARSIIKFFKDGDGFSYVYKTKDDHKIGTTSFLFWCNCRSRIN